MLWDARIGLHDSVAIHPTPVDSHAWLIDTACSGEPPADWDHGAAGGRVPAGAHGADDTRKHAHAGAGQRALHAKLRSNGLRQCAGNPRHGGKDGDALWLEAGSTRCMPGALQSRHRAWTTRYTDRCRRSPSRPSGIRRSWTSLPSRQKKSAQPEGGRLRS